MTIEGVVSRIDDETYKFSVDIKLYMVTALFKTCYAFIDKCYLYLHYIDQDNVEVVIKPKQKASVNQDFIGEFLNELINQRLRVDINRETGKIRELLVAKSLFEGALVKEPAITFDSGSHDNYLTDPKNIGELKGIE